MLLYLHVILFTMNGKDTVIRVIRVIRTLSNIHDGVFLQKQLTASSPLLFSQKVSS